jgi:hypothetical protein
MGKKMCFGFHGISKQSFSNNFRFTKHIGQSEEIMGIVSRYATDITSECAGLRKTFFEEAYDWVVRDSNKVVILQFVELFDHCKRGY